MERTNFFVLWNNCAVSHMSLNLIKHTMDAFFLWSFTMRTHLCESDMSVRFLAPLEIVGTGGSREKRKCWNKLATSSNVTGETEQCLPLKLARINMLTDIRFHKHLLSVATLSKTFIKSYPWLVYENTQAKDFSLCLDGAHFSKLKPWNNFALWLKFSTHYSGKVRKLVW